MYPPPIKRIRALLGDISPEQLRYVDCFVEGDVGLFLPMGGPCFFALTPRHSHPSYMFVLPFDDGTALRLGGKTIPARPGKLLALSPGVEHEEVPSERPPRYIAMFIGKRVFDEQRRQYPGAKEHVFLGETFEPHSNLSHLLKSFMVEADNSGPGSKSVIPAIGLQVCHAIIRSTVTLPPVRDRYSSRMEIERVVEYMHTHIGEKITVGLLSEVARMSPSHLSRVFRAETGSAPVEYLIEVRLERARKLLLAGDKTVTEIAFDCGFGSAAYLSARFSSRYGVCPSAYGKRANKRRNLANK